MLAMVDKKKIDSDDELGEAEKEFISSGVDENVVRVVIELPGCWHLLPRSVCPPLYCLLPEA